MPRFEPHPQRRPTVVTGASSGIGAAVAAAFAGAGHPVVLGARRTDRCEELAGKIRADGGEAAVGRLDLADGSSIESFCGLADREFGPIEVVVSNAGEVRPITVSGAEPAEFARQVEVNLFGAQALVHHLTPGMIGRRRGDIVFVTSEVAAYPRPHMAAYVASKAALEAVAAAMAMECEGTGVRVGIVRPGPTSTEQGSDWAPDAVQAVIESWQRFGFMRHGSTLRSSQVADAVFAMATAPRGARWASIEIQPEAPAERPADQGGTTP